MGEAETGAGADAGDGEATGAGDGPGEGAAGAGEPVGVEACLIPLWQSGNLTEHLQSSFMFCSQSFKGKFSI